MASYAPASAAPAAPEPSAAKTAPPPIDAASASEATPAPAWFGRALDRVRAYVNGNGLPPELRARAAAVANAFARRNGGTSLATAFTAPGAAPYPRLTDAYRDDLGLSPEDPRLDAIGEGAVHLYLHVRAQDDLIDDPATWGPSFTYAAEAFAAASLRAFAAALPGEARFFAFREAVMLAFLSAAVWELDVMRGEPASLASRAMDEAPARLGYKLVPMAIPLGALALVAGKPEHLDPLLRFASALGEGIQIVNDVLNVAEDHIAGRATPVLAWLYAGGRADAATPAGLVRALLLSDPALEHAQDRACAAIARASALAKSLPAPCLAAATHASTNLIDGAPARLLALTLGGGGAL